MPPVVAKMRHFQELYDYRSAALSQRLSACLELRSRSANALAQKINHDPDLVRQERAAWIDEPGGGIERGRGHGVVRECVDQPTGRDILVDQPIPQQRGP